MFIKPQTHWSLHPRLVTCDRLPGVSTAVQRRMDQQDKWDTAVQHYQRLLYRLPFGALKVRMRTCTVLPRAAVGAHMS